MNRKNGVRRSYVLPSELIKSVEDEADARLKTRGDVDKKKRVVVCRNIICIAIKRQLPEIAKMTKEEFVRQVRQLNGDSNTVDLE
jgi:hypothetical protein